LHRLRDRPLTQRLKIAQYRLRGDRRPNFVTAISYPKAIERGAYLAVKQYRPVLLAVLT